MSSWADGSAPEPDDEDTAERPVPEPQREAPDFIDRAPFPRAVVPDQAPIARFDQRPRFTDPGQSPPEAAPARPEPTPSRAPSPGPSPAPSWAPSPAPAPGPSPSPPPGIDATTGHPRRGLLIPAIAFGCAMLLLLGIGGGLTALWLTGRDDGSAPAAGPDPVMTAPGTEPGVWEPLTSGQVPRGDSEDLRRVLAQNPLLEARLQVPAGCTLPPAEGGKVPAVELSDFLAAGADCLGTAWADALAPVGITVDTPRIVVFTTEDLPTDSACETANFTDSAPVPCRDDNTLYWSADWDPGFSNSVATEAPGLYMWHLAYSFTPFVLAAADLDGYYGALLLELADSPEQADEAERRYALQVSCLSSAAAFQLPQGVRPAERVESFVTSLEAQAAPATAGDPTPQSRATWVGAGRDGRGFLGECATWSADTAAVA